MVLGWLSWLLPAGHLCFCGWLLEDGQGFYFAGSEVDRGLDRSVLCSGELGVRPHWIQRAFLCPASDRQLETHISKSTENTRTTHGEDGVIVMAPRHHGSRTRAQEAVE